MNEQDLRNQIWQFLREGWQDRDHMDGFQVDRTDIVAIGSDPDAAARTFAEMRGTYWQGSYISVEEMDWVGAWVSAVR